MINEYAILEGLELVSKLLPAAIGCEARGSALSAKKVLDVLQYASEPFPPAALPTNFSLDFAAKPVLKPVVVAGDAAEIHNAATGAEEVIAPGCPTEA